MKNFLLSVVAFVTLSSCNLFNNYGKKVEFGESEVYYKGEKVTEADAQKLGDYLLENKLLNKKEHKSVQLTNDGEDYIVHIVVDEKKLSDDVRLNLWKMQYDISAGIFNKKSVRIAFSDDALKDIEVLDPIARYGIGKSSLYYDNSEIRKADAKKIADFFTDVKLIGEDKEADIFYQKQEGIPVVRTIVNPDKIDKEVSSVFSYWQTLMREKIFNGGKAKLVLTSTEYEDLKPLPKLTQEQRDTFEKDANEQTSDQKQTNENTIDSLTTQTKVSGVLRLKNN